MNKPLTIGVILDGNRRYARENNLPLMEGHKLGFKRLKDFLDWADEAGAKCVIAYAFSTENWKRDTSEVSYLLDLFREKLGSEIEEINKKRGAVIFIGDRKRFSTELQDMMKGIEERTKNNKGLIFCIALSYGGRTEIISAAEKLLKSREGKAFSPVSEAEFSGLLDTATISDPDIIIRTGGEMRLSNFLPWQGVYSELFFSPTYWPAFTKEEFQKILQEYENRERRFGK